MIKRYQTSEMKKIWTEDEKYKCWFTIEIESLKAFKQTGLNISNKEIALIENNAVIKVDRIHEIEKLVKHDVVAFTRQISETLGKEKKWFHHKLTSTDVVDSAQAIRLQKANKLILKELETLKKLLFTLAVEHEKTLQIGRTHGIHAEITTFGYKLLLWHDEIERQIKRFQSSSEEVEVIKISGAVGNFANVSNEIQKIVAQKLNLGWAKTSSQVLQRDRHANYLFTLALIASSLEKFSLEIRHLQRTEVSELSEKNSTNQKGSSAMPHKKNPISSENIAGLARIIKSSVQPALENILLWHERDISHSSAERILFSQSTTLTHYILKRFIKNLKNLQVNKKRMLENIDLTNGLIFSQRILHYLIKKNNWSRDYAYDIVQKYAFLAAEKGLNIFDVIEDKKLLLKQEIKDLQNTKYYYEGIKKIFAERKIDKNLGDIMISAKELNARAKVIANMIDKEFANQKLVIVGILKGAYVFTADIVREIKNPNIEVEFIVTKSYFNGQSKRKVEIILDLKKSIKNKNIVIIEDIIDTGYTLSKIKEIFSSRGAKVIKIAAMCSKPSNHKKKVKIDFPVFEIPDKIVVGYGLDYNEKNRQLPYLTYMTEEGLKKFKIKK